MKIGILTFHQAENFGAILQTYALQTYLQKQGYSVEVIDYRCKSIEVHYQILNPSVLFIRKNVFISFQEYVERFRNLRDRFVRKGKFKHFIKEYLVLSPALNNIKKPLDYDIIIVGSDQVWNFYLNKGSENIYLLDFPFNEKTRKIAYAASSERNGLNRISIDILKRCLCQFDKISVRESFLQEILSSYTGKKIDICLDPTFLLDRKDYLNLLNVHIAKKYILVYHMIPVPEVLPLVEKLSNEKGYDIIEIYGGYYSGRNSRIKSDWGPLDVLDLIANAEMVFTTSFHGLALSVIMQKNVWVINRGENFRQKNLLSMLGLSARMISKIEDFHFENIDYKIVEERLKPVIAFSKDFLKL